MQTTQTLANPFALLMDPQAVFATLEKSGRLEGLQRRVCRPLDKPLIPHAAADAIEVDEADDIAESVEVGAEESEGRWG